MSGAAWEQLEGQQAVGRGSQVLPHEYTCSQVTLEPNRCPTRCATVVCHNRVKCDALERGLATCKGDYVALDMEAQNQVQFLKTSARGLLDNNIPI